VKKKLFDDLEKLNSERRMGDKNTRYVGVTLNSGMQFRGAYRGYSQTDGWLDIDGTIINGEQVAAYKIDRVV
jgi:hypothetical protein